MRHITPERWAEWSSHDVTKAFINLIYDKIDQSRTSADSIGTYEMETIAITSAVRAGVISGYKEVIEIHKKMENNNGV